MLPDARAALVQGLDARMLARIQHHLEGPLWWCHWYHPCVAVDIVVGILLALAVLGTTVWGVVSTPKTGKEKIWFCVLGAFAVVLTVIQVTRQAQSQDASLKTITGGDSFSFARLEFDSNSAYFVVLNSGQYPLYDLSMRLWQPDEWTNIGTPTLGFVWSKTAAETTLLGTLPNGQYRRAAKLPLPVPPMRRALYDIEFSARNGGWLQSLWARDSPHGWKVASIVRRFQQVGGAEAQKPGARMCFYVDQGFPFDQGEQTSTWAADAPKCVASSQSSK